MTTRQVSAARSLATVPSSQIVSFNGTTSKIVRSPGLTTLGTASSVLIRFRANDVTTAINLFANATGTNDRLAISFLSGSVRAAYFNVSFFGAKSSSTLSTGVWYSLSYTFNGTTGVMVINGTTQTGVSNSSTAATNTVAIGARNDTLQFFNGDMQGAYAYNRVLTASEVAAYHAGNLIPGNGMVLGYRMDEGSGNTVNDITGNKPGIGTALSWSAAANLTNGRFGSELRTAA